MAGGTQTTTKTSETSMERPGSSTAGTSEETVADLVFGEYTKDGPTPRKGVGMESHITHPWHYYFDGPRPDWYLPWGNE